MITLFDDQKAVVAEARQQIANGSRRVLIQAPCGFGKTPVASHIIKSAAGKGLRIYFLTHREELADQASRTFDKFGIQHSFIMAKRYSVVHERVFISMVDTLRNRLDKVPQPNLVVIDECHRSVSPTWKRVIDKFINGGAIVVGLSATPERLDGKPLGGIFQTMVAGPSIADLIARGRLAPYTYFAPPSMVDTAGVHKTLGDFDKKELEERSDKPTIIGDAIGHYKRLLSGKRAIVFAVSIRHSKHVIEQFQALGIPAAHVDGETPPDERKATVRAFERGEILVLSNVSLFGEGFDIKACDGVILLRATQSLALHIQMVGRAMRPYPGKERAVILDHVSNVQRFGLPDEPRTWTLDGAERKKKAKDEDEKTIRQCPECYATFVWLDSMTACPECGHVFESAGRAPAKQVAGELVEITASAVDAAKKRVVTPELRQAEKMEERNARSYEDFLKIANQRGYKPYWAKMRWELRMQRRGAAA